MYEQLFGYSSWLTLYFDNNEPSKNMHFLIWLSSLAKYSQEPRSKIILEILRVIFEKISAFYSDWPWWNNWLINDDTLLIKVRYCQFELFNFHNDLTNLGHFWPLWSWVRLLLSKGLSSFLLFLFFFLHTSRHYSATIAKVLLSDPTPLK